VTSTNAFTSKAAQLRFAADAALASARAAQLKPGTLGGREMDSFGVYSEAIAGMSGRSRPMTLGAVNRAAPGSLRHWLAAGAACACALGCVACRNVDALRVGGGSAWPERIFSDGSCSNAENAAAPPIDVMALHDALVQAGKRADGCLRPEERGTLLVVFGQTGCVRAILLERREPPRVEGCLVDAYAGARVPPFREGVIRAGAGWANRQ
jgi:hypothetical protein